MRSASLLGPRARHTTTLPGALPLARPQAKRRRFGLRDGARLPMSCEPFGVRVVCGAASYRPLKTQAVVPDETLAHQRKSFCVKPLVRCLACRLSLHSRNGVGPNSV